MHKCCNTTFLQICFHEETNSYTFTGEGVRVSKFIEILIFVFFTILIFSVSYSGIVIDHVDSSTLDTSTSSFTTFSNPLEISTDTSGRMTQGLHPYSLGHPGTRSSTFGQQSYLLYQAFRREGDPQIPHLYKVRETAHGANSITATVRVD